MKERGDSAQAEKQSYGDGARLPEQEQTVRRCQGSK